MKLESVTPSHCVFAIGGPPLEYFVGITSQIVAYRYHSAINKTYPRTSSEHKKFEEENKLPDFVNAPP